MLDEFEDVGFKDKELMKLWNGAYVPNALSR